MRPTADNVKRIQAELREPCFGEYHLFFSNMARDGMIQQLAEADEHEVVQQVRRLEEGDSRGAATHVLPTLRPPRCNPMLSATLRPLLPASLRTSVSPASTLA